jgi:hypothetical protein
MRETGSRRHVFHEVVAGTRAGVAGGEGQIGVRGEEYGK